jgi:hypothetical protein
MRLLITAACLLVCAIPAQAAHRHHRHHHYSHQYQYSYQHYDYYQKHRHRRGHRAQPSRERARGYRGGGIITVQTLAGPITVATHLAERFRAMIADFVAAGYKPRRVGCHAHGGHVPNSRHYHGAACDFDQTGWGRTTNFMYHARAIIKKHGFRDGCSFNDCGHVDDGLPTRSHRHYARHPSDYWFGG